MIGIILGFLIIAAGVYFIMTTKKANARRSSLMKKVSPENSHPGVILYAKIGRLFGAIMAFALGAMCLYVGFRSISS